MSASDGRRPPAVRFRDGSIPHDIGAISKGQGILVIEDTAQAMWARASDGRWVGQSEHVITPVEIL